MGMGIPKPNAGAQKPNTSGKGPGVTQQANQQPAMNTPQGFPKPVAAQNPAMGSNAPAPGGKAAGPQQMPQAMQSMASTLMGNQQMPQQPPGAFGFYQDMIRGGNPAQQQFMPQTQEMPQQQMPQNPAQQQIPQGQIDYFKQILGVQNRPNPQGTIVGIGPTDAPIYSNDPNAVPYTGGAMGGQYVNGVFQPSQRGGPSPIFNNPYLQGRPQMPGMGKGAMGKGMPAQGGKGFPAPGGKGYGPRQLPYDSQRSFNQQMPQRQMSDMSGLASLFNRRGGTD